MKKEITEEEYKNKYLQFKYGYPKEITEEEWQEFCFEVLLQLMEQNKEILIRLKEGEW